MRKTKKKKTHYNVLSRINGNIIYLRPAAGRATTKIFREKRITPTTTFKYAGVLTFSIIPTRRRKHDRKNQKEIPSIVIIRSELSVNLFEKNRL